RAVSPTSGRRFAGEQSYTHFFMTLLVRGLTALLFVCTIGGVASAQGPRTPARESATAADDIEPPLATDVIVRNAANTRAVIRAVRLTAPLRIDGKLDEEIYATALPISDFVQTEPVEGQSATEKTDVWIFFDRDNVYVVGRCWDTHPEREIADEMRRDSHRLPNNENFAF